jgi:hypothetical protein
MARSLELTLTSTATSLSDEAMTISCALDGAFTCLKAEIRLDYKMLHGVTADGGPPGGVPTTWIAKRLRPGGPHLPKLISHPFSQFPRSSPITSCRTPPAIPHTASTCRFAALYGQRFLQNLQHRWVAFFRVQSLVGPAGFTLPALGLVPHLSARHGRKGGREGGIHPAGWEWGDSAWSRPRWQAGARRRVSVGREGWGGSNVTRFYWSTRRLK